MANDSVLMQTIVYHYGADAKAWNYQRVVPDNMAHLADFWLAGYDGKPQPNDNWMEVELWGGDFDEKQDAELERKHSK